MPIKASEHSVAQPKLTTLLYGDSGSGKTSWGARAPAPLFFLTEPQGAVSVQEWNPEALIEVVDTYEAFKKAWLALVKTARLVEDDGQVWCMASTGGAPVRFQTLVIDGLTELQRMMMGASLGSYDDLEVSPDKIISSTYDHWRATQQAIIRVLSTQRALPCNTVVTCLAETDKQGKTVPRLDGNMVQPTVGQYFNAVGLSRASGEGALSIEWKQKSGQVTKPPTPRWPERSWVGQDPGQGTLGSLLLLTFPNAPVARSQGDSAALAGGLVPESIASSSSAPGGFRRSR